MKGFQGCWHWNLLNATSYTQISQLEVQVFLQDEMIQEVSKSYRLFEVDTQTSG